MRSLNNYLIEQLFRLDEAEISKFIDGLKPETREYLDIILEKAEGKLPQLKRFIDSE